MQKVRINEQDGSVTICVNNVEITIKSTILTTSLATVTSSVATQSGDHTSVHCDNKNDNVQYFDHSSVHYDNKDDDAQNVDPSSTYYDDSYTIYCYVVGDNVEYCDPLCMSCREAEDMNCICPVDESDKTNKFVYFNGGKNNKDTVRMTPQETQAYLSKRTSVPSTSTKRKRDELQNSKVRDTPYTMYDELGSYAWECY